jgi:hypothetical protein
MPELPAPMKGQWAFYRGLVNALNKKGKFYGFPKKGDLSDYPVHLNLNASIFEQITHLSVKAGWEPTDVMVLLMRRGLVDLYERLNQTGLEELGIKDD